MRDAILLNLCSSLPAAEGLHINPVPSVQASLHYFLGISQAFNTRYPCQPEFTDAGSESYCLQKTPVCNHVTLELNPRLTLMPAAPQGTASLPLPLVKYFGQ